MKKVITGHNADGKAIFVKEEPEEVTIGSPIVDWHEIWATHADDTIPIDVSDKKSRDRYSDIHQVFPVKNQSMFRVLDFKPGDLSELSEEMRGISLRSCLGLASTWRPKTLRCTPRTALTMA